MLKITFNVKSLTILPPPGFPTMKDFGITLPVLNDLINRVIFYEEFIQSIEADNQPCVGCATLCDTESPEPGLSRGGMKTHRRTDAQIKFQQVILSLFFIVLKL